MESARNCRVMSIPIRAWYILWIVEDCRTRIEAASRTGPENRDRAERAEQRKMAFYAKEVDRSDHSRRASLDVLGPPTKETEIPRSDQEGEDHSSAREAKRARGEPQQDLSGEIPSPSADETLNPPEIPAVSSGSTPSSPTSVPISPGTSSSSGVKRTCSESIAPSSPCVSSGSA